MALKAGYVGIKKNTIGKLATRSEMAVLGAKNLLENKAVNGTRGTITITVNADKTITLSPGTSASTASAPEINASVFLKKGSYIISSGATNSNFFMRVTINGSHTPIYNKAIRLDLTEDKTIEVRLYLVENKTLTESLTFYPMIRLASDPIDTYVPFAMTNHELTESLFDKNRVITNADDLNNITESGIYSITTAPTNSPENKTYATLIVKYRADSDITQIVITPSAIYTRKMGGSPTSWGSWYKYTGTAVQASKSGDNTTEVEEEPETKTTRSTKKTATIKEGE